MDDLVYHRSLVAFHKNQLDRRADDMPLNDTTLYHLINVGVRDMDAVDKPLTCPQSWRSSPASLQLSQSPYSSPSLPTAVPSSHCLCDAFAMLSLEVLCPWSFPTVPGASQTSTELRSLPQSSPVFSRVLQSLPELLLVRRSCCYFLRAPFPRSSSEILHEASPVFGELSCCLL